LAEIVSAMITMTDIVNVVFRVIKFRSGDSTGLSGYLAVSVRFP